MLRRAILAGSLILIAADCTRSKLARGTPYFATARPVSGATAAEPIYWPTNGWRESSPEAQGLRSDLLAEALRATRARNTPVHSVLIIRNGYVVMDAYFYPFARGDRHDIASITKSVTSVLAGAAAESRQLALSARLTDVVGSVSKAADARRHRVTLEDLLTMQSGFECGFGRNERELIAMQQSEDWVESALQIPMRSEPGTEFGYCSPNYHLVSAAIGRAFGTTEEAFAKQALFAPLGIANAMWPADPQGVTRGWGDLQLEPRDLAKIGYLYLHDGRWSGRQIVPVEWVRRSTTPRTQYGKRNLYGYGWWTNTDAPAGFFEAIGRGGQRLSVWPEKNLVVVITGGGFEPGEIGALLTRSLVADTAITRNHAGEEQLRAAVASVAAPPPAIPPSRSPLEQTVSGQVFRVDPNSMGLKRLSITFTDAPNAVARIQLRDQTLLLPVGLDGRYLIAEQPIDGVKPGARAEWRTPSQLALEVDLIGKIDHYTLLLTFAGDQLTLELTERTGLMHEVVRGAAVK